MKMMATSIAVLLVLTLVFGAAADVPRLINYQGTLTDENGYPLYGQHVVTFKIYYVLTGGAPKWEESQVVDVYEGLFHTILGGTTAIPDTLFDCHDLWMGLTVDSDPEIIPRMRLTSVPFAFRTAVAETAVAVAVVPGHDHDDRYYTETELNTNDGAINEASDPVDWTKLKSVPVGLADGVDDVGAGDGHSLDADDGNPIDVVYVDSNGFVGIGMTNPGHVLDVDGDVNANTYYGDGSNLTGISAGLKKHDTGWFPVSKNTTYQITHNLGTTQLLFSVLFNTSQSDAAAQLLMPLEHRVNTDGNRISMCALRIDDTNNFTMRTGNEQVAEFMNFATGDSQSYSSGYYRVITLALE